MINLGEFKAGTSIFYGANFHNDQGTIEDPTSPEAQIRNSSGVWSNLSAPSKQNGKTGHYGGTIDSTGFTAGQYIIRMAGIVTTAKTIATEFCFTIVELSGTNSVTITVYKHGTTTPIPSYLIDVYNSDESAYLGRITANSMGIATCNLDNGTYKLRGHLFGWTADNAAETLVVSGTAMKTIYATEVVIGTPASVNTCRVYEWCFNADDATPMTSVTSSAMIKSLPYDYNGKLHSGDTITSVYDSVTGKLYWDIVYGAYVEFFIDNILPLTYKTIPSESTKRLKDI